MKKYLLAGVLLVFSFLMNGCGEKTFLPERKELVDLELIEAVGIDKSPDNPEDIRVTITSKMDKQGAGAGRMEATGQAAQGGGAVVVSSEGKTVSEAARIFQTYNKKQVFWGYADFFIIGEEAAREDLIKYLDLLSRGQALRHNARIFIVKDATAEELLAISKTGALYVPQLLNILLSSTGLMSVFGRLELIELMGRLDDEYSDVIIPALRIAQKDPIGQKKDESDEIEIRLEGYAVFKDAKLIAFADKPESMGINFITNKVKSGVVNVKDSTDREVALEIIKANTKIIPRFDGDTVSVLVKAAVESNVAEMHSTIDIFNKDELEKLEEQQAAAVKQYMETAVKLAQINNTDILDIADRIYHKHPVKWQSLKGRWKEIFPNIRFDFEVASAVKRTYDIRQPNKYKAGEGE
ncbi:MAG: hypothetical protein VR72_16215 [Clostridiaceae bacterium BRH_c20a]|nr:MAG: hypothetical protein VR72_16215 [Clostridiaceae bacterium BRH_c20a]